MGTLIRTELETELLAALGNREDVTAARQVVFLNLAQMRIARVRKWEELERSLTFTFPYNQTDEDRRIAIAADIRTYYSINLITDSDSRSRRLEYVSPRLWDKRIPKAEFNARRIPILFTRWQETIEIWPMNDAAYSGRARVCKWPAPFTVDSDVVSDLDQKDDMLIALAASHGYTSLRMLEDAARWWNIYSSMLKDAEDEEDDNPDQDIKPGFEIKGGGVGKPWTDPFAKDKYGRNTEI